LLTNEDPHRVPLVVGDLGDFQGRLVHQSLPRAMVAATLAAADIGFMLRDSRELNRVASPVKFPEYLAAGLAIVASPGTGDASALVTQHQVGTLVNPSEIDQGVFEVKKLIAAWRSDTTGYKKRARSLVSAYYDWMAHAPTFHRLYGPGRESTNSEHS